MLELLSVESIDTISLIQVNLLLTTVIGTMAYVFHRYLALGKKLIRYTFNIAKIEELQKEHGVVKCFVSSWYFVTTIVQVLGLIALWTLTIVSVFYQ